MSPTKRALEECRLRGWFAEVTEKWNPWARVRQDLFGFCDVLTIRSSGTVPIQVTTFGNMGARIEKIFDTDAAIAWLCTVGAIEVWGWDADADAFHVSEITATC